MLSTADTFAERTGGAVAGYSSIGRGGAPLFALPPRNTSFDPKGNVNTFGFGITDAGAITDLPQFGRGGAPLPARCQRQTCGFNAKDAGKTMGQGTLAFAN